MKIDAKYMFGNGIILAVKEIMHFQAPYMLCHMSRDIVIWSAMSYDVNIL